MKKIFLVLMLVLIAGQAWCADEWLVTRPALTGDQWTAWPAASQANNKSLDRLLANYREGMTISYSSATAVSVSAGEVMCSNGAGTTRKMRQNTSATSVGWSDLDTGSEASSTTYYIYASCDADATTAAFKVSANSSAPSGITYYKRIGSFYNDSSGNISYIYNDDDNKYIGAIQSKSHGVVYQATADGFVCAYSTGQGVGGIDITGYSDSNSSPTTLIVKSLNQVSVSAYSSITMPVRKGNYWKVTTDGAGGTIVVNFIPFGN